MDQVGIESNSIDVIVSNCVINLVPDKEAVIREVARTLKDGGELYFSDVYRWETSFFTIDYKPRIIIIFNLFDLSDREVSAEAQKNEMLWGECISGALLWTELEELCEEYGLSQPLLGKV